MVRDDKTMKALQQIAGGTQDMIHGLCDAREGMSEKRAEWLATVEKIKRGVTEQTILLVGSFSAGKSTLINALLGENLLPTASSPCTSVTTEINFIRGGGHRGRIVEFSGDAIEKTDYNELVKTMLDDSSKGVFLHTRHVELFFDVEQLSDENHFLSGLEKMGAKIVDCPGYDSPYFAIEDITEEYMRKSNCIFWVSSAKQFGNASDVRRLSLIKKKAHRIIPVITMADLVDDAQREQIKEKFFEHLAVFFPVYKEPRFVSAHKWIEAQGLRKQLNNHPSGEERSKAREKLESLEMEANLQQIVKDIMWGGQLGHCADSKLKTALHDLSSLFKDIHKL